MSASWHRPSIAARSACCSYLTVLSAASACAVLPSIAEAQTREGRILEEVIVTSQRRAENIFDVPLSITAITAEDIAERGLFNAADYLRGVPGANQMDGGPFASAIVIRGIETATTSQNFNSGTTTATYFGETPTTYSAGMAGNSNVDLKLVDIERVEILRGPQGTGFGSSSLGGAVRVIPIAPDLDDFTGQVAAGYSATSGAGGDNYSVQAVANLPIVSERFAVRAVGYKYEDSGYYTNRAGSNAQYQANVIARFGVPSSMATDDDEVGDYEVYGGRVAALWQATDNLRITLTHLTQTNRTDGIPTALSGTYEQTLMHLAPEIVRRGQTGGYYDSRIDLSNATAEYDFGAATLLTTYSYIDSRSVNAFNFGYIGLPSPQSIDGQSSHLENVAEARLTTQLDGAWNFLVGLYYEDTKDGFGDPYFQSAYWSGSAATNPQNPGGGSFLAAVVDRRTLEQKAAYGEVSWNFVPAWTLTAGARVYDYERTRISDSFIALPSGLARIGFVNDSDASDSNFRANLSYKPDERALLYANFSQGFRLGRPQGPLTSTCDTNADGVIDGTNHTVADVADLGSDSIDNYEVGGKFLLLDRRVSIDAAAFRMDWNNIPVTLRAPPPPAGCGFNYVISAGGARSDGVELQAKLQLTDRVRVELGGSWLDARLTTDVSGIAGTKGNRLAGVPRVNANLSAEYAFQILGRDVAIRADSIYVGSFFGTILESPLTEAGDYVKVDTSFRLSLNNLSLDLYARNVTNEDAFAFRRLGANTPFFGQRLRPRTIGVQLGYAF